MVRTASFFARRGYVCAIQSVRGRFKSEGEWYPFVAEGCDGYDSIEWLASQEFSDSQVATFGSSYSGSAQSATATLSPPHLSAMAVAVGASNYYFSSMRHHGSLESRWIVYAFEMALSNLRDRDPLVRSELESAVDNIGYWLAKAPFGTGESPLRHVPSVERWLIDLFDHSDYDEYWHQRAYAIDEYHDEHADVPTLYLGGWYDSYSRGTCANYEALSRLKRSSQLLIMGPWTHGQWGESSAGDVDFGPSSILDYNDTHLSWFDHVLKRLESHARDWPSARIFVMGAEEVSSAHSEDVSYAGRWLDLRRFPVGESVLTPLYLRRRGTLAFSAESDDELSTAFVYDPEDPVPTIGGNISAAARIMRKGPFDQRGSSEHFRTKQGVPLISRDDIISFQTEPLPESLCVLGHVSATLFVSTSEPTSSFTIKLVDVWRDDASVRAFNILDSIMSTRYRSGWTNPIPQEPDEIMELSIALGPTAVVFKRGHRIRVDISSSNFPRFVVNKLPAGGVAFQRVFHDRNHLSAVHLPVVACLEELEGK